MALLHTVSHFYHWKHPVKYYVTFILSTCSYIIIIGKIQKILVKVVAYRVWGQGRAVQGWTWDLSVPPHPHPRLFIFIFILENLKPTEELGKNRTVNTHMASHESLIINIVATLAVCRSVCIYFLNLLRVSCTSRHFTPVSFSTYLPGTRTFSEPQCHCHAQEVWHCSDAII